MLMMMAIMRMIMLGPGDHAEPSTEALCNYDVHFDRGVDYVADDDDADDDGYHENDDDFVGGANDQDETSMTVPRTDKYHVYLADMMIAMMTMMMVQSNESDLEFVTSGTNGTCVKYFWARVKFSSINAKNHPFCEIC